MWRALRCQTLFAQSMCLSVGNLHLLQPRLLDSRKGRAGKWLCPHPPHVCCPESSFSQGPRDPLKGGGGQGLEQAAQAGGVKPSHRCVCVSVFVFSSWDSVGLACSYFP